jgi:hypothetical protein
VPTSANLVQAQLLFFRRCAENPMFLVTWEASLTSDMLWLTPVSTIQANNDGAVSFPAQTQQNPQESKDSVMPRKSSEQQHSISRTGHSFGQYRDKVRLCSLETASPASFPRCTAPTRKRTIQPCPTWRAASFRPSGSKMAEQLKGHKLLAEGGERGEVESRAGLSWPSSRPHPARKCPEVAGQGKRERRMGDYKVFPAPWDLREAIKQNLALKPNGPQGIGRGRTVWPGRQPRGRRTKAYEAGRGACYQPAPGSL